MKVFSFILALYILLLAMLPCSDSHLVFNESTHTAEYHDDHQSHDTHDHDENKANHCSPFCTCTCCHISIIFEFGNKIALISTKYVQVSTDDNTFLYYDSPSSTFLNTIWQPPKIEV